MIYISLGEGGESACSPLATAAVAGKGVGRQWAQGREAKMAGKGGKSGGKGGDAVSDADAGDAEVT